MLQTVSNGRDPYHARRGRNSTEALTASLTDGKIHLLLACSGSVATIKLPNIIQALSKYPASQLSIRIILTPSASRFLSGQSREQPPVSTLTDLPNVDAVDADEWKVPWIRGDGILHIELRRWADVLVIAPLSANTLAKISGGFADSLLTSVVRAWDPRGELDGTSNPNRRVKKRRIIVAPAMNTAMWRHPITAKQLRVLEEEWGVRDKLPAAAADDGSAPESPPASQEVNDDGYGYGYGYGGDGDGDDGNYDGWFEVLRPQSKVLACGDAGDGAMIEWTQIVAIIEDRLGLGHAAAA